MVRQLIMVLWAVLLLSACTQVSGGAAREAGSSVGRQQAARSVAKAAVDAVRVGDQAVVRYRDGVLRAPARDVEAVGVQIIAARTPPSLSMEQVVRVVDAACYVKDLIEAGTPDAAQDASVQYAAMSGMKPAEIYGLATDLADAQTSDEEARVIAVYLLCQAAQARS